MNENRESKVSMYCGFYARSIIEITMQNAYPRYMETLSHGTKITLMMIYVTNVSHWPGEQIA